MEKEFEKINSYKFKSFAVNENPSNVFNLKPLDENDIITKREKITIQERSAKQRGLEIFPFIREQKERKELLEKLDEEKYQKEISNRLKIIEKDAIKKGHEEGLKIAKEEITREFQAEVEKKIETLNEMLKSSLSLREQIYNTQKDQMLFLIKSLTKWVILRELKDDGKYLERLLEQLFLEIQTQQNFVVQVNQKDYEKMPEIMKILEQKLGEFKNSRVVIDFELPENGVVIDSKIGMIKSTLEGQFAVLDQIFGNTLTDNKDSNDGTGKV
ncbi:MAG: FliH/SctL family protein [Bacteriovoracales bacterium]